MAVIDLLRSPAGSRRGAAEVPLAVARRSAPRFRIAIAACCMLALAGLGSAHAQTDRSAAAPSESGAGDACRMRPLFVDGMNLEGAAVLGTTIRGHTGLVLKEYDQDGRVRRIHKHPSWEEAGHLGAFVYTERGDVFVAPAPLVSLFENPPDEQNRLYRVDGRNATMARFVELPAAEAPSVANPFGVIGLAYDCASRSLYAASVAGSTPRDEVGRIFRIDPHSADHEILFENIDAFGLGVRVHQGERRLYVGSARDTGVYSAPLDDRGRPTGEPHLEFHLAAFPAGGNEKAKSIDFRTPGEMHITAFDFNYSLRATGQHRLRHYRFQWDEVSRTWQLLETRITVGAR